MISYKEQLADSRWLKKKNEILERDNYTCQKCGATSHLNVHHTYYEQNKLAWEYPNESLVTLCDNCHSVEHFVVKPFIGEVYTDYSHELPTIGVCYHINYSKKEVCLIGIDFGGGWDSATFIQYSFESFAKKCCHELKFWNDLYNEEGENYYFGNILVELLASVYEKKCQSFYCYNFAYTNEMVKEYARKSLDKVLSSNETLYTKFNELIC